jgi:DNA-binding FrmR family transcriptional regulator
MTGPKRGVGTTIADRVDTEQISDQVRTRLRRIEGQVRGIQGMLDRLPEDRCGDCEDAQPCDGLLTQILAVRAAVEQAGLLIMDLHLQRCVLDGVEMDEARAQQLRDSLKLWSRLS